MKELNEVIKAYRRSNLVLVAAILTTSIILSVLVCIVIPNIIRSTMKEELDGRHGIFLNQLQVMVDEEFSSHLMCPVN